jgi:hypothetical protein
MLILERKGGQLGVVTTALVAPWYRGMGNIGCRIKNKELFPLHVGVYQSKREKGAKAMASTSSLSRYRIHPILKTLTDPFPCRELLVVPYSNFPSQALCNLI